jgi:hypothetical protein
MAKPGGCDTSGLRQMKGLHMLNISAPGGDSQPVRSRVVTGRKVHSEYLRLRQKALRAEVIGISSPVILGIDARHPRNAHIQRVFSSFQRAKKAPRHESWIKVYCDASAEAAFAHLWIRLLNRDDSSPLCELDIVLPYLPFRFVLLQIAAEGAAHLGTYPLKGFGPIVPFDGPSRVALFALESLCQHMRSNRS